jgi:probable F420-dependent oxidoreductase
MIAAAGNEQPKLGIFGINMGQSATVEGIGRLGTLAEELGYESIWLGEHVVAPRPRVAPSPIEPDFPMLDPIVSLGLLAGVTSEVKLGTGIIILPQRNPVVLAKELATLDVLSGGRFIFGIGVGYLEPELRSIGIAMSERGARTDEYLRAIRSLWQDDAPEFHGDYANFADVDAYPRPIQHPIPVVIGGGSTAALRRAVRHGDGWYGYAMDRAATAKHLDALRAEADAAGRDLAELTITITPTEQLDPDILGDYAKLGVDRLLLVPFGAHRADHPITEFAEFIRANAPDRLGAAPR